MIIFDLLKYSFIAIQEARLSKQQENVDKFQIHLRDRENFIVKISLRPNIFKKNIQETIYTVKQKMRAILDEKLMTNVKFDVQIVDRLWVDQKTGKFQLVILPKKK